MGTRVLINKITLLYTNKDGKKVIFKNAQNNLWITLPIIFKIEKSAIFEILNSYEINFFILSLFFQAFN